MKPPAIFLEKEALIFPPRIDANSFFTNGSNPAFRDSGRITSKSCAAEFDSYIPYFYSTYESENESVVSPKKKVILLYINV